MDVFNLQAKIRLDSSEYEQGLNQASDSTREAANNISASTVVIGNLMADLIKKGANALVDLGKKGVSYNAQIEKYTSAIKTSLGGTEQAAKQAAVVIEQIKKDAAVTPFSVDGLTQANMLLISASVNADDARDTIMGLSDAVSATGGGNSELQRMALNLQQIKNVGKATAMDIKQFQMAGIDIFGIIADYTGKTKAEIQDLDITYDLLSESLKAASAEGGRYFGANIEQSKTLNGMISTLADNVDQKLGEAFEGATEKLKELIPLASDFVQNMDAKKAASDIGDVGIGLVALTTILNKAKIATKLAGIGTAIASPFALGVTTIAGFAIALKNNAENLKSLEEEYANFGQTSEEVKAEMDDITQKLADAKSKAADDIALADNPYIIIWEKALECLQPRYEELLAAEQAAADGATDIADATTESTNVISEELMTLAQNYAETYEQISQSVKSYFGLFEEARTVEASSLEGMMNNLKSQVEFNQQYADSIRTMTDSGIEGMDELAQSIVATGDQGAEFALAIADAIKNKEDVAPLVEAWNEVKTSQSELTATIGETTTAFQTMAAAAQAEGKSVKDVLNSLDGRTVHIYYEGHITGTHLDDGGFGTLDYDKQTYTPQARTMAAPNSSGVTIVQNIQAVPQTPAEFAATTEAYFEQARWMM